MIYIYIYIYCMYYIYYEYETYDILWYIYIYIYIFACGHAFCPSHQSSITQRRWSWHRVQGHDVLKPCEPAAEPESLDASVDLVEQDGVHPLAGWCFNGKIPSGNGWWLGVPPRFRKPPCKWILNDIDGTFLG